MDPYNLMTLKILQFSKKIKAIYLSYCTAKIISIKNSPTYFYEQSTMDISGKPAIQIPVLGCLLIGSCLFIMICIEILNHSTTRLKPMIWILDTFGILIVSLLYKHCRCLPLAPLCIFFLPRVTSSSHVF